MVGFVLHNNALKVQLGYDDVQHFLEDECGTDVSLPTVRKYLKGNGLSQLVAKVRSSAQAAISDQQQVLIGLEFVELLEGMNFYRIRGSKLCNIDVTTTKRSSATVKTIAASGKYVSLLLLWHVML